jgi:DNA-binding LacI/PurR family transcriptional regulator
MATIRDVARLALVTPTTVSRVLNNSGYVKDETRLRVEKAIAELDYVPTSVGQSLRFKRTRTLGLVISDISSMFWITVIRGAERAASAQDYNLILADTEASEEKERRALDSLVRRQVDGVILMPATGGVEPINFVQRQGIPIVVLDHPVPGASVDVVRCDTEQASYGLVRLLIELGHRRIAMLTGPRDFATAADRADGYRRALQDAGLAVDETLIHYGRFQPESGYDMAARLLELPDRPTAVATGNDFIALGAIKAFRDAGLSVPSDISMVTFDVAPENLVVDPFFTSALQPGSLMGEQAAELLIRRLDGESMPYEEVLLPTRIVEYSSTARPRS